MKLPLFVSVIFVLVACYSCSPVKKENFTDARLLEKVSDLEKIIASENVSDLANSISSIAQVLNEEANEKKSAEVIKSNQELREQLVTDLVNNVVITNDTSLADVSQIFNAIGAVTDVPEENSEEMLEEVANFMESASDAILEHAKEETAPSFELKEASKAVFGTAVNLILSANSSQDKTKNEFGNGSDLQKAAESQKRARRWVDVLSEINSVLEEVPNTRKKRSTDEDAHLKSLPQFPETDVAAADFAKVRHASNLVDKFEEK